MTEPRDSRFTLVAHTLRGGGLLDVVDDEWLADKLPDDEIAIPPGQDVPSEDEGLDEAARDDDKKSNNNKADKWQDLGLDQLEAA